MTRNIFSYITAAVVVSLLFVSCGQGGRKAAQELKTRAFPNVTPPAMMQEQDELLEFMAMHYWDAATEPAEGYLCDSLHMAGIPVGDIEQSIANYLYLLDMMPMAQAKKSMRNLASRVEACESADTSSNVFETMEKYIDKYVFDPNSPLRNEDLYQAYTSVLSKSMHLSDVEKEKYTYLSYVCSLNAVGTKAADFTFCDSRGREHNLYDIKADNIVLFFSNPGCEACLEIINSLKEDSLVNAKISDGSLAVVNVYIDEDIAAWRDYMPIYPDAWYNGFDPEFVIRNETLYNVRAIPSLYLLDSEKKVLLKDAVTEKLFQYLSQL